MNISKFTVLGALEEIGTGSGYDIWTNLEQKKISQWTDIKKGSIYFALKQLLKEGCIVNIGDIKDSAYPTRTIYKMTNKGHELFDSLQEEAFNGLYPSFIGFKLALKFNIRKSPSSIIKHAIKAIDIIDKIIIDMDNYIQEEMTNPDDAFFIEHDRMLFLQEKSWIKMVVKRYEE